MTNKWECDGCLKVIEHADPQHICGCPNHWGWMLVGGIAWHAYHDNNVHPMSDIIDAVKQLPDPSKIN